MLEISCLYLAVLVRNNEFSYSSSYSRNNFDSTRYFWSRSQRACACALRNILMACIHGNNNTNIGSFPVCINPFLFKNSEYLICGAAREITSIWIVIFRTYLDVRALHIRMCVVSCG